MHVVGGFSVGCRPTDLWPKAEVTRVEAARENERKKAFMWVTIKTLPNRKPCIKSLWALRVIEPLFWKQYIDNVFSLGNTNL